ncbi:CG12945 [Drosophila busckii]|uniref:CG12945 n=1 Tax=Drosophila busckii TaxID=30019 RepID=A0A0M3QXV6_DROBS|nr:uncharacterized protein LOC108602159 [Drosophila busckii]ALC46539.1 CG12945 [Drosophila busckii]
MRASAVTSCLVLLFHSVCCKEDAWIEPHAWSELSASQSRVGDACECTSETLAGKSIAAIDDQLALTYFRKFVNSLFSRKSLQYSEKTKLYKTSLLFTLLPAQVEQLETAEDVRDIDIVLNKILNEMKSMPLYADGSSGDYFYTHQSMGVRALITDIFKDLAQLLTISEVKFMLAVLFTILLVWFVHKRYRFSVLIIVISFVFLYGYFYTYLECNRKLEVDAMLEVIDDHQKNTDTSEKNWFSRMFSYFSNESPETQQKRKLHKASRIQLPYCRPDHVFIMYTSEIFIKQIEMLLEKTTQTMSTLNSQLSWPFNLIAPFALVALIGYLLKLTFKYIISPKVWMGFLHGRPQAPRANITESIANEATGDRLSGDNLKMLLNVITATNNTQTQQQLPQAVSGVQEVLELEFIEAVKTSKAESSPESKSKSKTNSSEKLNSSSSSVDLAQEAGFTFVADNKDVEDIVSL